MKICLIGKDGVQFHTEDAPGMKEPVTTCIRSGAVYIYRATKSNNRQSTYQLVSSYTCVK